MKNIFLTLALLLTVSFAFAGNITQNKSSNLYVNSLGSNSINSVELTGSLVGTCYVKVHVYSSTGEYITTNILVFENVSSASDCYYIQKGYNMVNGIK